MLGLQRPSAGLLHTSTAGTPQQSPGCHRSSRKSNLPIAALLSSGIPHHSNGNGKTATLFNGHEGSQRDFANGSGQIASWDHGISNAQPDEPVLAILQQVANGTLQPAEAASLIQQQALAGQQASALSNFKQASDGNAPEIVWAPGKQPAQISRLMAQTAVADRIALAVRVEADVAAAVTRDVPDAVYNQRARTLRLRSEKARKAQKRLAGTIAVISASTANGAIAEECRVVADALGCYAFRLPDVSVDKLDGILGNVDAVRAASIVVVVAGADGALPSVIAGLVSSPVVAIPSVGAPAAALGGTAGLLGALAAASAGVAVSHVDSGVGAALLAARMLRCADRLRQPPV